MLTYNLSGVIIRMVIGAIIFTAIAAFVGMDYATHSIVLGTLLIGYLGGWVARTYAHNRDHARAHEANVKWTKGLDEGFKD